MNIEVTFPNFNGHYINISGLWGFLYLALTYNQSINQSNPVLLKEGVRIPRTRHAGGAAMLWGALPLDGARLQSTVHQRWSPRHSILSAGLRLTIHFQILLHTLIPSLLRPSRTLPPQGLAWTSPYLSHKQLLTISRNCTKWKLKQVFMWILSPANITICKTDNFPSDI